MTAAALGPSKAMVNAMRHPSHNALRKEYALAISAAKVRARAKVRMLKCGLWFAPSAICRSSERRFTAV